MITFMIKIFISIIFVMITIIMIIISGSDTGTSPLAPQVNFLKKWLFGQVHFSFQADFLSSPHIFV